MEKLEDISDPIDIVNVFRRSEYVLPIIEDAISINAKAIWLQDGVVSEEGALIAKENEILFINLVEQSTLFCRHLSNNRGMFISRKFIIKKPA